MFGDKETREENATLMFFATWWWVFLIALAIIGTLVSLALMPTFNNLWLKGFRTTNNYQTTKIEFVYTLMNQYERNDSKIAELKSDPANGDQIDAIVGQQKGIVARIQNEVNMLDDAGAMVPDRIRAFLSRHRGE